MDPEDASHRSSREGHAAVFLVGLLLTALLVFVALITIGGMPVFQATAPTESYTKSERIDEAE